MEVGCKYPPAPTDGFCCVSYVRESSGLLVSSLQALFYWPLLRPPNNAAQVSCQHGYVN